MFEINVQSVLLVLLIIYTAWDYYVSRKVRAEDSVILESKLRDLSDIMSYDPSVARMFSSESAFWELFEASVPAVSARPFLNSIPGYKGQIPNSAVRVLLLYLQPAVNPTSGDQT